MGMVADTSTTPATANEAYEFLSESLTSAREIVRTEGLRGSRLHPTERVRQGRLTPGGSISMQPTYAELVNLLPRIISSATNHSGYKDYTVSDSDLPPYFQVVIDRVAKVVTYVGCKVNRARFHAAMGQPLSLDLEIEALNESIGNSGTFPSLTISATPPFVFTDGALSLASTTYQVMEFETTIDWHLKPDRFVNQTTRTDLVSLDLMVGTRFVVPYTSDTTGLYDGGGGVSGIAGNINFTYGGSGGGSTGVNLKFTYGNLIFPARKSPSVNSRDEITLLLEGEARKTGSTAPLVVQLDSTT